MTENVPPVPPTQNVTPQSYPSHGPDGPIRGNEPPYGSPQPYAQAAPPPGYVQQPYPQHTQYVQYPPQQFAPPAGQWVPAGPAGPKSSGYRVASSIVAIVLGVWLFLQFLVGVEVGAGFASILLLIAAFGTLTSAIVLLAKHRGRLREAPLILLGFTSFAILVSLIVGIGFGFYPVSFVVPLLAAPVFIVMGIGLSREKRGL
jgi:hypothetical protein